MQGKSILLISPQAWGKMFVAKHHYAVELAAEGNTVYFLNPPQTGSKRFVNIEPAEKYPGVYVVDHSPSFPLMLRFRSRKIFDWLMKRHVSWLLKQINKPFDIVWCFEPNLYTNLDWFGATEKIYHPVDELLYSYQLKPADHADLVISVTREILEKFPAIKGKKLFINHGVSKEFVQANGTIAGNKKSRVAVGYSGNLLRRDIDFKTIKECIQHFPDVDFIFWGNYEAKHSNLAGEEADDVVAFIEFLKHARNVQLKGAFSINELVKEYGLADIFLICYDIEKDQSKGTNYHKVMEFLSTGKVVVSNNITTYKGSNLLRMCVSRDSNSEMINLLGDTISHCEEFNSPEKQAERKNFARQNTYLQHIKTIEQHLTHV